MFSWVSELLSGSGFSLFSDTYTRFINWFTEIQRYYSGVNQNWATSSAYNNAMTQYNEFVWHMSLIALIGFIIMVVFFYKLASSFVGWWRVR